jgi:spermidine synthase
VPAFFSLGYETLLKAGEHHSAGYLFQSWLILTLVLLPVCTLIGATLPFIMKFLEAESGDKNNFGYLYSANLAGALIGCLMPILLIEIAGFKATLVFTAALNIFCVLLSLGLYKTTPRSETALPPSRERDASIPARYAFIVFLTGFAALGSEVVWIRSFAQTLSTTVYAFAAVLAVYLVSNFAGTWYYLKQRELEKARWLPKLLLLMPAMTLLPAIFTSQALINPASVISIAAICFIFGYLTPYLIDKACANDPAKTARLYSFNFLGCILGPLFTTYALFPLAGLNGSLVAYSAALWIAVWLLMENFFRAQKAHIALYIGALTLTLFLPNLESELRKNGVMYRDQVGYIGAIGKGMDKALLVNGVGMTNLTTITKNMAYLPLAYRPEAQSVLAICFGMGTTVRSLTRWPLQHITVVELSEGVVKSFAYFHPDAGEVLADPRVKVVIDDGRRFLNRTSEEFDIITIDPPPPVPASGSGLLYSSEFIALAKNRLAPQGILAHWIPENASSFVSGAVIEAMGRHFKHVQIYRGFDADGTHILGSDMPLPPLTPALFTRHFPAAAMKDLKEWHPEMRFEAIAKRAVTPAEVSLKSGRFISDDRLYNEFYILRKLGLLTY